MAKSIEVAGLLWYSKTFKIQIIPESSVSCVEANVAAEGTICSIQLLIRIHI